MKSITLEEIQELGEDALSHEDINGILIDYEPAFVIMPIRKYEELLDQIDKLEEDLYMVTKELDEEFIPDEDFWKEMGEELKKRTN